MTVTNSSNSLDAPASIPEGFDLDSLIAIEERLGVRAIERLVRGPARSRPVAILRRQSRRVAHPLNESN